MVFLYFLRSTPGRLLRIGIGFGLIFYGATHPTLAGLVLMMVGVVPAVTGLAGICLLEEVLKSRRRVLQERPRERRV